MLGPLRVSNTSFVNRREQAVVSVWTRLRLRQAGHGEMQPETYATSTMIHI